MNLLGTQSIHPQDFIVLAFIDPTALVLADALINLELLNELGSK